MEWSKWNGLYITQTYRIRRFLCLDRSALRLRLLPFLLKHLDFLSPILAEIPRRRRRRLRTGGTPSADRVPPLVQFDAPSQPIEHIPSFGARHVTHVFLETTSTTTGPPGVCLHMEVPLLLLFPSPPSLLLLFFLPLLSFVLLSSAVCIRLSLW